LKPVVVGKGNTYQPVFSATLPGLADLSSPFLDPKPKTRKLCQGEIGDILAFEVFGRRKGEDLLAEAGTRKRR
jgi:hypothetical protein